MDLQALLESGALSIEALTADINELPHTPTRIGDMRLFSEEGIDTTIALIGLSDDKLTLVPNVPRGSPSQPKQLGPKNAKPFLVPHLPQRSTVMADSLQGARTFGKQGSEVEAAAAKVVALNGKHRRDLDYTIEYHRLGAIKGLILDADGGLFSADFRASERMAQLIVQVAGRAGRAEEPGKVIIQSHLADHPLLVQLTEQGYFAFAEQALSERRSAGLPPFCHLALLRAEAHKPGQAESFLDEACSEAEHLLGELGLTGIELLGPVPAPMERRAGRIRAQLLLQSNARAPLHRLLNHWLHALEQMPSGRAVRWSLDVDPIDLF